MSYSHEALTRARSGGSLRNDLEVIAAFIARGVSAHEITPRENVLTFAAWQALGRHVRKGEKGVKLSTWIPMTKKNADTGEKERIGLKPRVATVFHISQTELNYSREELLAMAARV